MQRFRHYALLLAMAALGHTSAGAQERDAQVVVPGRLRIDFGADYVRAESRFGTDAAGDPWGLNGRLDASRFLPLEAPAAALDAFLALPGTGATALSGDDLFVGELDFDAVVAARHIPIRIALGIFDRVEVGVSLPVLRTQRLVRRFDVVDGNVGANPDVEGNTAVLAGLGAVGEALGGATLLPVSGSPAGEELQARVAAATGGTLTLPATALTRAQLAADFDFAAAPYDTGVWEAGDLVIDARFQLLRSFAGALPENARRLDYRAALFGAYRLPVELTTTSTGTVPANPLRGYSGPSGGVAGDLFLGERFWLSAGASMWRLSRDEDVVPGVERTLVGEGLSLARPGDGSELWVQPRVRMTREMSLGATLRLSSGDGMSAEGRTSAAGLSLRFSNLPGPDGSTTGRPLDAALGFITDLGGPSGAVRATRVFAQLSIQPRLWGGPPSDAAGSPSTDGDAAPLVE